MHLTIPTYDVATKLWTQTAFATRDAFVAFLWTLWKEPGQYGFDETSLLFNEQARKYNKTKVYCTSPFKSKDYIDYWEAEKAKCRYGAIYKDSRDPAKTWYLPRDYYMWINFLPIYNKEVADFTFPDVRDVQYHMALYEELAKQSFKHAAILKKRQIASSFYHAGKMINYFWFEKGWINKMAGALKDYINEKGTWRFLEGYRDFLNQNTAWYRPCTPDKLFNWEQKVEVTVGGRKQDKGLKSVILGLVLDKDATNGVGGPCNFFFHEEGGVAPNANKTWEYILPAMKSGMIYTGMCCIAGSVGDLKQCEPLREMILMPGGKDVLAVKTNLLDEKGTIAWCGLFIPEQWSMQPCIDQYGNSEVEKALAMIMAEREEWKRTLKPADYQLRISQKPTNIKEAFSIRGENVFPAHLVAAQKERIENKEYFLEYLDVKRGDDGKPFFEKTNRLPISEFPISPKTVDKEGIPVIHERPIAGSSWGTYYASVDPVGEGKTTTSDSLFSIYIWKNPVEVTRVKADGSKENEIEPGKLVAWWCGRFDDINKTHERASLLIELYQAWTIVENNVAVFLQYMIEKKRQKYLVPKDQILFLKELGANRNVFQEYGWKNTGNIFKGNLIAFAVKAMSEELDRETDVEGNILRVVHGVTRFGDNMLFEEMQAYREGLNVDRLIAFCALMAFVAVQGSNRGSYHKRTDVEKKVSNLENSRKNTKLLPTPFRHVGRTQPMNSAGKRPVRSGFRNMR